MMTNEDFKDAARDVVGYALAQGADLITFDLTARQVTIRWPVAPPVDAPPPGPPPRPWRDTTLRLLERYEMAVRMAGSTPTVRCQDKVKVALEALLEATSVPDAY